jgi:dCMP deaminase
MNNRISWTAYFLNMALITAQRSACLSNMKGCVVVKENRILGTGYNGPPTGLPHCQWRHDDGEYFTDDEVNHEIAPILTCPRRRMGFRSGEGLDYCSAVHAETNAIIIARTDIRNATLYCSFHEIPCRECAKLIINSGIKSVVLNGTPIIYPQIGLTGAKLLELAHVEVIDGRTKGNI